MTNMEMYVRLLTETHHSRAGRRTFETRARLQDVLCELRNRAALERGEETQNEAERLAEKRVGLGSKTAAVERRALELGLSVIDLRLQREMEIVFMDKVFEIAGSLSEDVVISARNLESCLDEADKSGNSKRIEVAFQTMFALRMLEEVCTNSPGSMTDDQLIVALEHLTRTNREN